MSYLIISFHINFKSEGELCHPTMKPKCYKDNIPFQAVTSKVNPRWGFVMKMTFKRIWEWEYDSHPQKWNIKTSPWRVTSRLERKQLTSPWPPSAHVPWLSSGSLYRTQTPWACTIGSPQMHFSFSASRVLFHFYLLCLFSSHYFISGIAKLPLLTGKRIIQEVLFPLLI